MNAQTKAGAINGAQKSDTPFVRSLSTGVLSNGELSLENMLGRDLQSR